MKKHYKNKVAQECKELVKDGYSGTMTEIEHFEQSLYCLDLIEEMKQDFNLIKQQLG